jgi:DNA-binding CsgD family transcriptional regulator
MGVAQALQGLVDLGGAGPDRTFESLIEEAAPRLDELVRAASQNAYLLDAHGRPLALFGRNIGFDTLADYAAHYRFVDPMYAQALERNGVPAKLSDYLRGSTLRRSEYFADFLRSEGVQSIMGVSVALPRGGSFLLACHRPPRNEDFSERDRARWQQAGTELGRAVAAWQVRCGPDRTPGLEGGLLLLDPSGHVLHASGGGLGVFESLVRAGKGPGLGLLVRGVLAGPLGRDKHARISVGAGRVVDQTQSRVPRAVPPQVSVYIQVDPIAGGTARERCLALGLSRRETEVAILVARGLTNAAAGHELGLKPVTIRDHLRSVFSKLRVASRTELAAVVFRSP